MDGLTLLDLPPALQDVARLIAAGLTNGEIAVERGVTEGTIKNQVHKLGSRLGDTRRVNIAKWYWKQEADNGRKKVYRFRS